MLVLVGLTLCVPDIILLPDQAPEAVQDEASAAVQLRVLLEPLLIDEGLALRVTVGAGAPINTVTVVEAEVLPPAPLQMML